MISPTKELARLILAQKIRPGANSVLCWMADSINAKQDPKAISIQSSRIARKVASEFTASSH